MTLTNEELTLLAPESRRALESAENLNLGDTLHIYAQTGVFSLETAEAVARSVVDNDYVVLGVKDISIRTDQVAANLDTVRGVVFADVDPNSELYNCLLPYLNDKFVVVVSPIELFRPTDSSISMTWLTRNDFDSAVKNYPVTKNFRFDKQVCDVLWEASCGNQKTLRNFLVQAEKVKAKGKFMEQVLGASTTTRKAVAEFYRKLVDDEVGFDTLGNELELLLRSTSWKASFQFLSRELVNDVLANPVTAVNLGLITVLAKSVNSEAQFVAFCLDLASRARGISNGHGNSYVPGTDDMGCQP